MDLVYKELKYFKDVENIWNGMIDSIKDWSTEHPGKMKNHTPPEDREDDGTMDHLLFWPVGQKGVAHYLYGIIFYIGTTLFT